MGQCRPSTSMLTTAALTWVDPGSALTDDGRVHMQAFPPPQGLTTAAHEHDACGVAFVATLTGVPSHDIVSKALTALRNLEHRGAAGAEPNSGDGAGILMQVPDRFFREVVDFELPAKHSYAAAPPSSPVTTSRSPRRASASRRSPPRRA